MCVVAAFTSYYCDCPRAEPGRLPIGLWLGDGWFKGGRSIERSRQVIPSGGQAGQALHAHLPFPDGERGNARVQCLGTTRAIVYHSRPRMAC